MSKLIFRLFLPVSLTLLILISNYCFAMDDNKNEHKTEIGDNSNSSIISAGSTASSSSSTTTSSSSATSAHGAPPEGDILPVLGQYGNIIDILVGRTPITTKEECSIAMSGVFLGFLSLSDLELLAKTAKSANEIKSDEIKISGAREPFEIHSSCYVFFKNNMPVLTLFAPTYASPNALTEGKTHLTEGLDPRCSTNSLTLSLSIEKMSEKITKFLNMHRDFPELFNHFNRE